MPAYIVTVEINDSQRLNDFTNKLKIFGGYCPILKNAWAISTDMKAIEIVNFLTSLLSPSDRIFVIRSGTEAAWRNSYGKEYTEWLKKYL